jgi:glucose dehydrogenase
LWRQRRRAPYNTATLTTGGGLVFVGTWDRYALAYDISSGRLLWQALPTLTNMDQKGSNTEFHVRSVPSVRVRVDRGDAFGFVP